MLHTVDENTQASTPGQIKISKRKYLDYIKIKGLIKLKYSFLLSLPINYLFKYMSNNPIIYEYIQKTEQFKFGCLNPTIIINKDKGIIATFTNLTSIGDSPTPVIKISKERLDLITNITLSIGQRLPSVALYFRDNTNEDATAWMDFDPKVANCFTDDLNACNELLKRLSLNAWKCLEEGLTQVGDIEDIGLYYVELNEQLVNESY